MDCGQFTPVLGAGSPFTQVHFFPKKGNQVVVSGQSRTIPPGVGVISGGVIGTHNNASINKVLGQTLAASTLYYVYVYVLDNVLVMDFSTTGHIEDQTYGNEVHATDQTRSLIGMVFTGTDGKFVGQDGMQLTLSWFNRGHLAIGRELDGIRSAYGFLFEANSDKRLHWLQWGVNNSFVEGFSVPNVYFHATVVNNTVGSYVHTAIRIDGVSTSKISAHYQASNADCGTVAMQACPHGNEGYHWASFMMGNGGFSGEALVTSGYFGTSPLFS